MNFNFLISDFTISLDLKIIIIIILIAFILGMLTMSRNNWQGAIIERQHLGIVSNMVFLSAIGLIFLYLMLQNPSSKEKSSSPNSSEPVKTPIQGQRIDLLKMVNYSAVEKTPSRKLNEPIASYNISNQRGSPSENQTGQSYVIQIAALKERTSITVLLDQYSQDSIKVVDGYDDKIRIWIVGFKTKTEAETYRRAHQIEGYIKAI